ncbi:MAG: hypothetical protein HOP09_14660 [Hyphomicrobium sp.]|nr:hypothetical protein [Hyphomicrobium sp.]
MIPTAANTGIHEFVLQDALKQDHRYLVVEHNAGDGMDIMFALMGAGAPAILGLVGAVMRTESAVSEIGKALEPDGDESRSVVDQIRALVADVDIAALGADVQRVLTKSDATALVRRILKNTHRDGKPLSDDFVFGGAYKANYFEALVATWRVISINRFFPLLPTLGSSG